MGISYQDHRIRIGIFNNKIKCVSKVSIPSVKRPHSTTWMDIKLVLIFSLLFVGAGNNGGVKSDASGTFTKHGSFTTLTKSVEVVNHNFESRYKFGNKKKNGIKIMHWNPGAKYLHNKLGNIESVINGYKPDILGISESNFLKKHDLNDVQIDNYKLFLSETLKNENIEASRIAVYVHDDIACKVRTDLMNDTFSSIWLEINLPRQKKFLVCHAYREWQYLNQATNDSKSIPAQSSRWMEFLCQWERGLQTGLECLVLGDLNIDHTAWTKPNLPKNSSTQKLKPLIENLFDKILPLGAVQCVNGPTRYENGVAASGLDHFWTSNPNKLSDVHTYFHGSSDHKIVIGTRYTKCIVRNPRYIRKRSYKNFNSNEFLEAVQATSWWDLYTCEDPEQAVNIFTSKLTLILDEMAPMKTYQVRKKYAPWLTNGTKGLMTERDLAQKKAAETGKADDWKHFRKLRNQINSKLKKEKTQWQANRMEMCSNTSDTWKTVKNWLGWKSGGPPTQLVVDGELKSKPKDLSKCMNEFFINKVRNLRADIPACRKDPFERLQSLMANRNCVFSFKAVHPDEVKKVIDNLKNSKTCGVDNIDSFVIKLAGTDLTPAITHIANLSLSQSYFPSTWKTAKVIPLFKKEDATLPKNYRPVSLLPVTSKILERVAYQQLVEYLEQNHLLHHSHHGFRKHHSTTTALLEMYSSWVEAYQEDKVTAVVLLDMSAAFDLVDKSILIEKLKLYGLDGKSSSWMESYMSERSQRVYIDGDLSEAMTVEVGVPQGSILGPILYCLMVNDLPELPHNHLPHDSEPSFWNNYCSNCGGISCFADDSSFSLSGKDPAVLKEQIKSKYSEISDYMAANRLVLNSDKTHLLVMASRSQHRIHGNYGLELDTGNEIILPEDHQRLLGCEINSDFTWKEHLQENEFSMQRQLTSRINALKKISFSASFKTRKMVANGVVISRIIYVIQLWGGTSDFLIKMLQVLQNKAARFVTQNDIFTSQKQLLLQCGWMSVRQLVVYHDMVQIFKTMTERKPVSLHKSLCKSFTHRTRAASTGGLVDNYKTTREIMKESFLVRSTKTWNMLPPATRQAENMQQFKFKLKAWIRLHVTQ